VFGRFDLAALRGCPFLNVCLFFRREYKCRAFLPLCGIRHPTLKNDRLSAHRPYSLLLNCSSSNNSKTKSNRTARRHTYTIVPDRPRNTATSRALLLQCPGQILTSPHVIIELKVKVFASSMHQNLCLCVGRLICQARILARPTSPSLQIDATQHQVYVYTYDRTHATVGSVRPHRLAVLSLIHMTEVKFPLSQLWVQTCQLLSSTTTTTIDPFPVVLV
jgi:hypothetical protein